MSAIVTGGASGLGAATARRLAQAGVKVVIVDQDAARAKDTAASLGCDQVPADITDEDQVLVAVARAADAGELRLLVNCAGIAGGQTRTVMRDGSLHDLAVWRRLVDVNLVGTYNVCRLFAAAAARAGALADGERGAIVMTASVAAHEGQAGQTAYAAAKAGVVGLTLPLARDLQPLGIRVNTISPGTFATPMLLAASDAMAGADSQYIEQRNSQLVSDVLFPRRVGEPAEYAELALHLLVNRYLNGEVVRIDGGLRMRAK